MSLALDSGPSTPALPGTTVGAALDRAVATWGDREALVSVEQGLRFTYAELSAEVDRVARGLLARGVGKGDRVGIWSPNCAEWVLVQYATARLGAVLVTINPAYRTHERIARPFKCTVQAPHMPMPQPNLVPLSLSVSRIAHSRGMSSSTSTVTACPLSWNWLMDRSSAEMA